MCHVIDYVAGCFNKISAQAPNRKRSTIVECAGFPNEMHLGRFLNLRKCVSKDVEENNEPSCVCVCYSRMKIGYGNWPSSPIWDI